MINFKNVCISNFIHYFILNPKPQWKSEGDYLSVIKIVIKESLMGKIQSVATLWYQRGHQDSKIPICMTTQSPEDGLF